MVGSSLIRIAEITTRFRSLSLVVPLVVIHCHSMSLDVITRLSLYKRSFQIAILKLWVEGLIGIMIIFTLRITYYYN